VVQSDAVLYGIGYYIMSRLPAAAVNSIVAVVIQLNTILLLPGTTIIIAASISIHGAMRSLHTIHATQNSQGNLLHLFIPAVVSLKAVEGRFRGHTI